MKTNSILINLFSAAYDAQAVERICGKHSADVETRQNAEYTVENGLATIHSLAPFYGTTLNLPLPFVLPVNDLGSGLLQRVEINCDTLTALTASCPKESWVEQRKRQTTSMQTTAQIHPTHQALLADYIGLF